MPGMPAFADVVICSPLRTPVGRLGGALSPLGAADLGVVAVQALARRLDLQEGMVDDVVLGHCTPGGEAPAIGRVVALDAGLGLGVPGVQVDRRCGSGLQAVLMAATQVASGVADVVIAGGTESMSNAEHYALGLRDGARGDVRLVDRLGRSRVTAGGRSHPVPGGMVETAENLAREYDISREEQDAYAARSQQRAGKAMAAGFFDEQVVPVEVAGRGGTITVVDRDEHPRPDTTAEDLAGLRPVVGRARPDATVTAGNASGQNDGAAVCVVTTRREAERRGWRPVLRPASFALAGCAPETMGLGPVPAAAEALDRAGLGWTDLDLIELNEAFAAQVLAVLRGWGLDPLDERLNPHGSGISLGHPLGATGARILADLAVGLQRREGRYALETMCIGGGQGLAAVFERIT